MFMDSKKSVLNVYTDGACKNNPGRGGYAYVVCEENQDLVFDGYGSEKETTNNRMEITAVIVALESILDKCVSNSINVHTDSAYVANAFNELWIEKWERNGWKTTRGDNVLNKDLWEKLILTVSKLKNNVEFIKLSRNNEMIKRADKMAKEASRLA
jgi:ribonuclease HI